MKKLAAKIFAIALPFLLYFSVFVYFEPYNYFGLKEEAQNADSAIARVRLFLKEQPENLILGDSRMAHFDLEQVEACSGQSYGTLAFGGAALNESIDLFWFAVENDPNLKSVVVGVSFYTLNQNYYKDRMSQISTIVSNPLAYLLNFDYNLEMLNQIRYTLAGVETGAKQEEGIWPEENYLYEDGTPRPPRPDRVDYAQTLYGVCEGYTLNEENITRLIEVADYCAANDIRFTVVMPPVDSSITDLVLEPLGIDKVMEGYLPRLTAHMRVLNYEHPRLAWEQSHFYDGFHLDPVRGLPEFTVMLFQYDLNSSKGMPDGH